MRYTVYLHTHSREGYPHTDYLCFICATDRASVIDSDSAETIHPVSVEEGRGQRTECTLCNRKLNWMDT